MKTCKDCGVERSLDDYYASKTSKDGRISTCKPCVRQRAALYREAHPKPPKPKLPRKQGFRLLPEGMRKCSLCEEVKDKSLFYVDRKRASGTSPRCKECANKTLKARRKDPSVDHLTARRKWAEENREKLREQERLYRETHRDAKRLSASRRRARKNALPDTLTIDEIELIMERFGGKCALCSEDAEHLDHFIPIATGYGGTTYENTIPLCGKMNASKHARNPFEWAEAYLEESQKDRFTELVKYLSDINNMSVDEYIDHVNSCFN